jgi:hypothetical protein
MALGIGANETTFMVEERGATNWTKFPPVFLFVLLQCRRLGLVNQGLFSAR